MEYGIDMKGMGLKPSGDFWKQVEPRADQKLRAWKFKTFEELSALPESSADGVEEIDGKKVEFSVNCWHREPDSVILVVRASIQSGFPGQDYDVGFVMSRHGQVRTASEDEVRLLW